MEHWQSQPFRTGAAPFDANNEAGVVYCFDEANRKVLKKSPLGKQGDEATPRTLANLAGKKLLSVFRVTRDGLVQGFAAVGPPPSTSELALGEWQAPQTALLSLPSGQLRLETALSFSLGPEFASDDGVFIDVPPGEYQLTFVEADQHYCPPGVEYRDTPRILLTLTPAGGTQPPPAGFTVMIRPAPPPVPKGSILGDYRVENGVFTGKLDGAMTNFDRKAAEALGLRFGARIRLANSPAPVDACFIDRLDVEDLHRLTDSRSGLSDALFVRWSPFAEPEYNLYLPDRDVLWFADGKGLVAPIAGTATKSRATITLTGETPLPLDGADLGDWSVHGETLQARVLTNASRVFTLNVGTDALTAIGARVGDSLQLSVDGDVRRMTMLAHGEKERPGEPASNWRCRLFKDSGDELAAWIMRVKQACKLDDEIVRTLPEAGDILLDAVKFLAYDNGQLLMMAGPYAATIREHAAKAEPVLVSVQPFVRPPALCAALVPHWGCPGRDVLWVEAEAYVRDYSQTSAWNLVVPHEISAEPGAKVELRRI